MEPSSYIQFAFNQNVIMQMTVFDVFQYVVVIIPLILLCDISDN